MIVHNVVENRIRKIPFVKLLEFWQWLCRKPSAGLIWAAPFGVQYAAAAVASSEAGTGSSCSAMTQHYPITSAAAAVSASGPSFPVSAMLLISTIPYYLSEHYVKRCCL